MGVCLGTAIKKTMGKNSISPRGVRDQRTAYLGKKKRQRGFRSAIVWFYLPFTLLREDRSLGRSRGRSAAQGVVLYGVWETVKPRAVRTRCAWLPARFACKRGTLRVREEAGRRGVWWVCVCD